MNGAGIQAIGAYPAALRLDLAELAGRRGLDAARLKAHARSVCPPWEDPVTLAVNAATSVVQEADRDTIGLLIVATESGVDLEKPISSWVHRYLELRPDCRNFEIKHACYGATAAMQMATAWLSSASSRGRQALVVSTDQSFDAVLKPWELVCGAGACAVLLSENADLLAFEGASGVFAREMTDVIRPNMNTETGNSQDSLYSYLDALEGSYEEYCRLVGESEPLGDFDWHVYHMPFPAMALTAHRTLLGLSGVVDRKQAEANFEARVAPSVGFASEVGGVYSGSTLLGMLSLLENAPVREGQRVSVFSYGSGSCSEFYALRLGAAVSRRRASMRPLLAKRPPLGIEQYELFERQRRDSAGAERFEPSLNDPTGVYETHYAGQRRLVLERIDNYYRYYRWS